MKMLVQILSVIAMVGLLLTGMGIISYSVIEFISSFFISTINLVVVKRIFRKIIYVCFGCAVCSFLLSCFIDKNMNRDH